MANTSGTGNTMFLEALGHNAVAAGRKVAWFSLETLGILVRRHRADDTVTLAITRILRADVAVVDDIGLLPVSADAAYEKRSVAVSSNLHPSGFDEIMPKPSPAPPSTGSCTTPTSAPPPATVSASPKPPPARGSRP